MANKKVAVFGIYSTRTAVESATDALVTARVCDCRHFRTIAGESRWAQGHGDRKGYESA